MANDCYVRDRNHYRDVSFSGTWAKQVTHAGNRLTILLEPWSTWEKAEANFAFADENNPTGGDYTVSGDDPGCTQHTGSYSFPLNQSN